MSRSVDKNKRSQTIDKVSTVKSLVPNPATRGVDTTKEFVDTINYNLNSSNTGFQVIMSEQKDPRKFQ